MTRKKKPFRRTSGVRDAKLIVIASEGEVTERLYFDGLASSAEYSASNVHVEVLRRENRNSDPKALLISLSEFKRKYTLKFDDELWVVCDVDRWGNKKLAEVNRLCKQKGFFVAVSNPCFEIWLLLHFITADSFNNSSKEKLERGCNNVILELKKVLGSYSKTNIEMGKYLNRVEFAIDQAKTLDQGQDWPTSLGTRIYALTESIIDLP